MPRFALMLVAVVALLATGPGCLTYMQVSNGSAPAAMGGTRLLLEWTVIADLRAADDGDDLSEGGTLGGYLIGVCDLPFTLLADLVLLPFTIPSELAHDDSIELFEFKLLAW